VGIMAVNMRNSMQKNNMAALLYTLLASLPEQQRFFVFFSKSKFKIVERDNRVRWFFRSLHLT
jgi:hypothetical protein